MIIGTKNNVLDLEASIATKAHCHFVNKKWLCGMLMNWSAIEMKLQMFMDLRAEQRLGKLNNLPKGMQQC